MIYKPRYTIECRRRSSRSAVLSIGSILVASVVIFAPVVVAVADDGSAELRKFRREIEEIRRDEQVQRGRLERDEKLIDQLEKRLAETQARDEKLASANQQLETSHAKLQSETETRLQNLQQQFANGLPASEFGSLMDRYLGTHQFTLTGSAAASFIYDRQSATNTFSVLFEPLVLYKLNDWILFEAEIEAALPAGSEASFGLPIANAQLFLNDYLELVAGIFDQPFGDWYEDQSALWVNRFVTAPLLYGAEPVIPPTDIGFQLRGGLQWGVLGQDIDYTAWIANGPSFDSALPEPVVGQALQGQNNIGLDTNGRAFGARVRFYPFPIDSGLGRLEVGASTYNGKWLDSNWFYSWGLSTAYLYKDLQARAEFVRSYRQLPAGSGPDNREGWYVQVGYFLQHLPSTGIDELNNTLHRLELLARYSGVNQRAIVADEVRTEPGVGFSGSASIFSPHAREVALGIDYWIEPSIVWQTEFDLELPRAGGTLFTFDRAKTPTVSGVGATANDPAILTQLSIGF